MRWFWGIFALWLVVAVLLLQFGLTSKTSGPEYCYFVIDERGNEFGSVFTPYFSDYGIYYDTDNEWGVVTSPSGMRVDKNCLRAKGVEVDPVTKPLGSGTP